MNCHTQPLRLVLGVLQRTTVITNWVNSWLRSLDDRSISSLASQLSEHLDLTSPLLCQHTLFPSFLLRKDCSVRIRCLIPTNVAYEVISSFLGIIVRYWVMGLWNISYPWWCIEWLAKYYISGWILLGANERIHPELVGCHIELPDKVIEWMINLYDNGESSGLILLLLQSRTFSLISFHLWFLLHFSAFGSAHCRLEKSHRLDHYN